MMLTVKSLRYWLIIAFTLVLSACGEPPQPTLKWLSEHATILAFGDSLTYGTGANHHTESYPAVLSELSGRTVINAGIPGEISSEGLQRIESLLMTHEPDLVLLCHGGNDLIRKLGDEQLSQNLEAMISIIRQYNAEVVLLSVPKPGLMLKPAELYRQVASKLDLPIEHEIIAEIESETSLKSDPIHPNAKGYRLLAQRIQTLLEELGAL